MKSLIAAASLLSALAVTPADAGVRLGILMCTIEGGTAYVVGSNKTVDCAFQPSRGGGYEHYTGIISKLGVDIGFTHQGALQWAVLAAGRTYEDGALAGKYYGVSAEASVATGGGVNLLLGGFRRRDALIDVSNFAQPSFRDLPQCLLERWTSSTDILSTISNSQPLEDRIGRRRSCQEKFFINKKLD